MGEDAEVFIFDYEAYETEVGPLFRNILLTGKVPEWLQPLVTKREIDPMNWGGTDLLRFCSYLGRDFSWNATYDLEYCYDLDWQARACTSLACPERERCPFHQSRPQSIVEWLPWLFQIVVSVKCLGQSQFVGRSLTVSHYRALLSSLRVTKSNRLYELLTRLGKRGFVIGYQWGFGFEGINGWLTPDETIELACLLEKQPLPTYELSFVAMREFCVPHPNKELHERFGLTRYECLGCSFEALSLSFVRTVARLAASENKGVLWGLGVMRGDFYSERYFSEVDT